MDEQARTTNTGTSTFYESPTTGKPSTCNSTNVSSNVDSSTAIYVSSNTIGTMSSNVYVHSLPNTGIPSSTVNVPTTGNPTTDYNAHGMFNTGIPSTAGIPSSDYNTHGMFNTGTPSSVLNLPTTGTPTSDYNIHGLFNTGIPHSDIGPSTRSRIANAPDMEGILSEKLYILKKSYSSYKGHLTRIYNELDRAVMLSDLSLAQEKRNNLMLTFDKLTDSYNKLTQLMSAHERDTFTAGHIQEIERKNVNLLKYGQWITTVTSATTMMTSKSGNVHASTVKSRKHSSVARSRKSTKSGSSRLSRVSAKAKLEKARLRLQRLEEKKELERKLEEHQLQTEIEEAQIDVRFADEVDSSESDLSNESLGLPAEGDNLERICKYLEECSQQSSIQSFAEFPDSLTNRQSTQIMHTDSKVDEDDQFETSNTDSTFIDDDEQLIDATIANAGVTDDRIKGAKSRSDVAHDEVTKVNDSRREIKNAHASGSTNVNREEKLKVGNADTTQDKTYEVLPPANTDVSHDNVKSKVYDDDDASKKRDNVYDVKHDNVKSKVYDDDVSKKKDNTYDVGDDKVKSDDDVPKKLDNVYDVRHKDVKPEFCDDHASKKKSDVNDVRHTDVKPEFYDDCASKKKNDVNDRRKDVKLNVNDDYKHESDDTAFDRRKDIKLEVKEEDVKQEIRSKVIKSEMNTSCASTDSNEKSMTPSKNMDRRLVDSTADTSVVFNVLQRQQETMDEVVRTLSMPKRGYMSFDGDPLMYPLFIKNFEINIEKRETHDSDRLSYLIQFCKGKAKEAIEHCIMMSPSKGYNKAKDILKRNFGRTHVVSKAFLDKVIKGPPIKITESEKLSQLSRDMETCMLGSTELGLESNLDSLDTLGKIVNRLPVALKSKWAEKASQIYEQGSTPKFLHLAKFIEQRATVANTYFGQMIQDSRPDKDAKQRPKAHYTPMVKATTLATTSCKENSEGSKSQGTSWRVRCPLCDKEHYLDQCESFRGKTPKQRMDVTSEKELCRSCLKKGHVAKDCRKNRTCSEEGCKGRHHPLLHTGIVELYQRNRPSGETVVKTSSNSAVNKSSSTDQQKTTNVARSNAIKTDLRHVSLKVVPVKVKAPEGDREIETYAFLDDGSDTTMCLRSLADELGIEGKPVQFVLSTMSGDQQRKGRQLSLDITGVSTGKGVRLNTVWTTDQLPITEENVVTTQEINEMDHLKDIDLAELPEKKITLLIGSDTPEALCPLEVRSGSKGEPYALRTLLGWTVTGPMKKSSKQRANMNFIHVDQSIGCDESEPVLTQIHDEFVRLYNSEFSENTAEVRECLSVEDQRAKKIMDQTVQFVNGHYQIGLPWKVDRPQLPNNKSMAKTRLMLLKKRLLRDPKLLDKYKDTMEQYISRGHAVKVQEVDENEQSQQTIPPWYLPHHPVTHPQKPEKVRVVFDCAAVYNGTSLNQQLLQGPDNTNSLVGVLLRFRKERVAFMSDVEQMFHQVYVEPRDRNALRFLWWPDGNLAEEPVVYKMNVHLFGATSSPSVCSYALRKAADDSDEYSTDTIEAIKNSFYVDDCLRSVASVDEAIHQVQELTSLLAKRGFRLTKWVSNERDVLSAVPSMERAKSISLDLEELPVERALGVQWDVERDTLGFRQGKETSNTRRGILSFVASIYDPLGLAAPFVLPAKMMLQELCRIKYNWDASLPDEYLKKWMEIKKVIETLKGLDIPRCYKPPHLKELLRIELHHFADASAEGYGTASYLRLIDIHDNVHCTLILGKSRVAPLKTVSIPRLELTAATLAVKVDKQIQQELQLPVHRVVFWTDSLIVIGYVRNENKRFQTFVANRLQTIHDASSPQQWRHVPTGCNPADLSSRGINVNKKELDRWLNGPEFLRKKEEDWPLMPENIREIGDDDAEVKGSKAQMYAQVKTAEDCKDESFSVNELLHRWSSWYQLCKMIAWLLRYKQYLKWRCSKGNKVSSEPLSVAEIAEAEDEVIKLVQREFFSSPQTKLCTESGAKIVHSRLQNLNPITKNGILRVGGRLTNATVDEARKHPAILPSKHHVTTMIIRHYHRQNGHVGCNQTLAAVRKKFWIIKGPSTVKRILNSCVPCRRQSQQPPKQIMAPLPKARVTSGKPPFSSTGVDYFGPLFVKYRRGTTKRYGCLFTCLSTRAVHIEVSSDLTTDSFIQAVSRFVSRRGPPGELYSDNGSNFRGSESDIKEALNHWNQGRIREQLREKEIQWYFNAPSASHTGGVWERIIRSTRRILKATVGRQLLDDETLSTTLCEVEKILNDRPLTAVSSDPNDLQALTPNSLLLLRENPSSNPCPDQDNVRLKERWKLAQSIADSFWERWIAEYLPTLQERQKWLTKQRNMSKGDLVMIKDDSIQRGQWPLGRIMETYPDGQGIVRRVLVRTAQGSYERNIRKLMLLEQHEE